jgi:hypothetical protein
MTIASFERLGAACFMVGSTLLAGYAVLFAVLIPVGGAGAEYSLVVLDSNWARLSLVAFIAILFMLAGLDAVFSRIRATAGLTGTIGFLLTKIAFVLQACVLTWELLVDPIIAANAGSAFLLRERIIANDPGMVIFRWGAVLSIFLSTILFGLAVYRSKAFPRSALVLIMIGAVAYAIGPMISIILAVAGVIALSVGCILIGARLWRAPTPA